MSTRTKFDTKSNSLDYGQVSLVEPSGSYYIHLAMEVDESNSPFYLFDSKKKKRLLDRAKLLCQSLEKSDEVLKVNMFKAVLIPPGRGRYIKENAGRIKIARYDLALLIEVASKEAVNDLLKTETLRESIAYFKDKSKNYHQLIASNVRNMGPVKHNSKGVYLFNYFYAEDIEQNLEVWNYTAAWFEKETGLRNSELMLPVDGQVSDYTLINHCRWDRLLDILPSLVFKRSFQSFVLDSFYENQIGAMPILYRTVY